MQAGLTLTNAVFTHRQRKVRFEEGQYDSWQEFQQVLAKKRAEQAASPGDEPRDHQPADTTAASSRSEPVEALAGEAHTRAGSSKTTSRRNVARQVVPPAGAQQREGGQRDTAHEGSDGSEDGRDATDEGLAARLWDDLVDMDRLWTHAVLAIIEAVAGTSVLTAFACCLGAPLMRDPCLTTAAMALLFVCLYSVALPMQWVQPLLPDLSNSSVLEEPAVEAHEDPDTNVYHWLLPLQLVPGILGAREPLHPDFHRSLVLVAAATVWASAVIYPMDWGRAYQDWPLPTVYAAVAVFILVQGICVLGWKAWSKKSI